MTLSRLLSNIEGEVRLDLLLEDGLFGRQVNPIIVIFQEFTCGKSIKYAYDPSSKEGTRSSQYPNSQKITSRV